MLYEKTKSNTALKDRIATLEHQLAEEVGPHYTLDTVNALVKERDELKAEIVSQAHGYAATKT
jgi:hypothetical protein